MGENDIDFGNYIVQDEAAIKEELARMSQKNPPKKPEEAK
jgi:hypothetical protein